MKRLAILGASGHGKVVADLAETCGWHTIEFFDDSWPHQQVLGRWAVVGDTHKLLTHLTSYSGVIVAIGNNSVRHQKQQELVEAKANLATLIHPSAIISQYASLGAGSVVMACVVVNAGAIVGVGSILNTACSVDHDCVLGNSVHISPGARLAGGVNIGDCTWIGIGASVRQGVKVGSGVTVGAGAAVVEDLSDGTTAVGVPARVLKTR